ncbi:sel1 repeat family protein [Bosea lathyri]|uniref:Sel1 repeat-containing protein n=1 Tax=Bosea lathyri TaxID=1036778 RepID=A0A1H6D313_9HYPH|nr:sel1 repeat family protein [Bosea lathyri]SEG79175.1 hypothetical protein SAMN04488115_11439 [Bosea lathyri]
MSFHLRHATHACMALAIVFGLGAEVKAEDADLLDLVKECDILAAHPSDPKRMAEGVSDDRIVPRLAVRACEQAIKEDSKDPRFSFQLGRALLAAGKKTEAATEFRKSAQAGHAAGWAYLGDALQFGHGQPIDYEKAREAYGKARDGGFERAAELVSQLNFLPDMYAIGIMAQLYSRDFSAIATIARESNRKWLTRAYVFSLVQKLVGECDEVIAPTRIVALYTFRYGGGWSGETDAQTSVGIFSAVGEHDARLFLKRHGCDGVIAKHVFSSIDSFLAEFKET